VNVEVDVIARYLERLLSGSVADHDMARSAAIATGEGARSTAVASSEGVRNLLARAGFIK
jgi:hypothetical protein